MKIKTFLGFLFFCFMVPEFKNLWFYCSLVLWFHGFLASKVHRVSISCFQEDLDLISNVFKISLYGSSGFFGASLFENYHCLDFPKFDICKNHIFSKMLHGFSLISFRCPGVPKDRNS